MNFLEKTTFGCHIVILVVVVDSWLISPGESTSHHALRAMLLGEGSHINSFHASINTSRISSYIHLVGLIVEEIDALRHVALIALTSL